MFATDFFWLFFISGWMKFFNVSSLDFFVCLFCFRSLSLLYSEASMNVSIYFFPVFFFNLDTYHLHCYFALKTVFSRLIVVERLVYSIIYPELRLFWVISGFLIGFKWCINGYRYDLNFGPFPTSKWLWRDDTLLRSIACNETQNKQNITIYSHIIDKWIEMELLLLYGWNYKWISRFICKWAVFCVCVAHMVAFGYAVEYWLSISIE